MQLWQTVEGGRKRKKWLAYTYICIDIHKWICKLSTLWDKCLSYWISVKLIADHSMQFHYMRDRCLSCMLDPALCSYAWSSSADITHCCVLKVMCTTDLCYQGQVEPAPHFLSKHVSDSQIETVPHALSFLYFFLMIHKGESFYSEGSHFNPSFLWAATQICENTRWNRNVWTESQLGQRLCSKRWRGVRTGVRKRERSTRKQPPE